MISPDIDSASSDKAPPPPFSSEEEIAAWARERAAQLVKLRQHVDFTPRASDQRAAFSQLILETGILVGTITLALRQRLVSPPVYEEIMKIVQQANAARKVST